MQTKLSGTCFAVPRPGRTWLSIPRPPSQRDTALSSRCPLLFGMPVSVARRPLWPLLMLEAIPLGEGTLTLRLSGMSGEAASSRRDPARVPAGTKDGIPRAGGPGGRAGGDRKGKGETPAYRTSCMSLCSCQDQGKLDAAWRHFALPLRINKLPVRFVLKPLFLMFSAFDFSTQCCRCFGLFSMAHRGRVETPSKCLLLIKLQKV
jgi:hypothetical protein